MCFSFEADLAAAAVLTPLGILTLRAAKTRSQIAVASIPLFFAAHQGVEAFVWLGTDGKVSDGLMNFGIYTYLVMAQMILPVLVPLAVRAIEPEPKRRLYMAISAVGGVIVAANFGYILITQGATAYPLERTMVYKTPTDLAVYGGLFYVNATILTTLVATGRYLRMFGVANVIGICMAGWLRWEAVTSVWCVYAAFISGLILLHLQAVEAERRAKARAPRGQDGLPASRPADAPARVSAS